MKENYSPLHIASKTVRYAEFRPRDAELRVQVVQVHPDDKTMAQGIDKALVNRGVSVVVTTLVDGAAGKVYPATSPRELAAQRWEEDVVSARLLGSDGLYSAMLPYDGCLEQKQEEAKVVTRGMIEEIKPDALVVPNWREPHRDHAVSYAIVTAVADGIPVYAMDTLLGQDAQGNFIDPTHYVPLTRDEQQEHSLGFFAHKGQTRNRLPEEHMVINNVLAMPEVRGTELRERFGRRDVQYAGTLVYDARKHRGQDPIADVFGKDIFIRAV